MAMEVLEKVGLLFEIIAGKKSQVALIRVCAKCSRTTRLNCINASGGY
jgi:hypothetical protein